MEASLQEYDSQQHAMSTNQKPLFLKVFENNGFISDIQMVYKNNKQFKLPSRSQTKTQKLIKEINIHEDYYVTKIKVQLYSENIISVEFMMITSKQTMHNELAKVEKKSYNPSELTDNIFEAEDGNEFLGARCVCSSYVKEFIPYFGPKVITTSQAQNNKLAVIEMEKEKEMSQKLQEANEYSIKYLENLKGKKKLESVKPTDIFITCDKFKGLYTEFNTYLMNLNEQKRQLDDQLNEALSIFQTIYRKSEQISKTLELQLNSAQLKFNASYYSKEKEDLDKLDQELIECDDRINRLMGKFRQLRASATPENMKNAIMSSDDRAAFCKLYDIQESIAGTIDNQYQQLLIELQQFQNFLQKTSLNLKATECEKLVQDQVKQNILNDINLFNSKLSEVEKDAMKQATEQLDPNYLKKEQDLIIEEQKKAIQNLTNNYNQSIQQINKQIQAELQKINSGALQNQQQSTTTLQKNFHIIIVIDESGSMSGSWSQVQSTTRDFIASVAKLGPGHEISEVLFDNQARIICRKELASNVQPLPNLKSGGTTFTPAFKLSHDLVVSTKSDQTPFMIFMTDGGTSDSDIQTSIQCLKGYRERRTDFVFFTVGFGTGYDKQKLVQLSNAGNNNQPNFKVGDHSFQYVNDAINESALKEVFTKFSSAFDCMAQEKAIELLQKQLQRENHEFQRQLEFFENLTQQKIRKLQEMNDNLTKNKEQSIEDKKKYMTSSIKDQIEEANRRRETVEAKQSAINEKSAEYSSQICTLNKQIEDKQNQIKLTASQKEKQIQELTKQQEIKTQKLNDFLTKSGFQTQGHMVDFYNAIDSCLPSIVLELNIAQNTRRLIQALRDTNRDFKSYFDVRKEKQMRASIDEALILEEVKKKFKQYLDSEMFNNGDKILIMMKILERKSKKDYEKYHPFLHILLQNISLKQISEASDKSLTKLATKLTEKLRPNEKKKDDSDSEKSDEGEDEEEDSQEEDILNFVACFDVTGEYELPETMKQLKTQKKGLKNEIKDLKDKKDVSKEVKFLLQSKLDFIEAVEKEELFVRRMEGALKIIQEVVFEGFSKQLKQKMINELKIVFGGFKSTVKQLQIFEEIVSIHSIESEKEINDKLEEEQDKYNEKLEEELTAIGSSDSESLVIQ